MLYTYPDYYGEFQCIAEDCEDTCCAGWQIVADEKSLKKYSEEKSEYGDLLRSRIDWKEGTFLQNQEKRCAFLREDNLCDMYAHLGEKSLCKTCKLYPRHVEEFEGIREVTLSVSCPEVARILLKKANPVVFKEKENQKQEKESDYEEFDPFLYSILCDAREAMISILQNRDIPIVERAITVLGMAYDMQSRINKDNDFGCYDVIDRYQSAQSLSFIREKTNLLKSPENRDELYLFSRRLFACQKEQEKLDINMHRLVLECEQILFGHGKERYFDYMKAFEGWINCQDLLHKLDGDVTLSIQLEQLLVYFISVYFCGGVYDGKIYGKAQMSVYSVWFIYHMLVAVWLRNEQHMEMADLVEIVYKYSRELEHSDPNLLLLEQLMLKNNIIRFIRNLS